MKLFRAFGREEIVHRAGAVAFQLTLSVFPALIFLFSLVPFVPIPNLTDHIMRFFAETLPAGIYKDSEEFIYDIVAKPHKDMLSIGFFVTMMAANAGVLELMNTFQRILGMKDPRNFIRQRLSSIGLTVALQITIFITIALILVGQLMQQLAIRMLHDLGHWSKDVANFAFSTFRFSLSIGVFYFSVSALYYFGTYHKAWPKFFSPGGLIASILTIVSTHIFSIYVVNFGTYNKLYGSLGTIIVFMLWIWIVSIILLAGFLLNKVWWVESNKPSSRTPVEVKINQAE